MIELIIAGILASIQIAVAAFMTRWYSDGFCVILTTLFAVFWGVVQVKKAAHNPATSIDPHFQRHHAISWVLSILIFLGVEAYLLFTRGTIDVFHR